MGMIMQNGKIFTGGISAEDTTYSIEVATGMPSGMPIPNVTRRGHLLVINFGIQIPAKNYGTSTMWKLTPAPLTSYYGTIRAGSSAVNIVAESTGNIKFNSPQDFGSATWLVGQLVCIV